MPSRSSTPDPRSIITPEAFEVSEDLLGRPLAGPWSRLLALFVDLVLIGVLSLAGGLVLGVVAVVFLARMATSGRQGDAFSKLFRGAVGCLGVAIVLVTTCTILVVDSGPDFLGPGAPGMREDIRAALEGSGDGAGDGAVTADLTDVLSGLGEVRAFRNAETVAEAEAAAERVARRFVRVGVTPDEAEEAIRELAPPDAPWREELDRIAVQATRAARTPNDTGDEAAPQPSPDAPAVAEAPAAAEEAPPAESLTLSAALERYRLLVEERDAGTPEERALLERRLISELATDSLSALAGRIEEAEVERDILEERLARSREELAAARSGGLLDWIRRMVDDLGLAFGWASIYMTVFLTWWNGQTPGKKLLGIRVVQLDQTPLTWWESFERAGGYAAGFATGLLGFAQIFWDPNRQAIHDKISETVVVVDGAEPVAGRWQGS